LEERRQESHEAPAAARERTLFDEDRRREEKIRQLMERFHWLSDEKRYRFAEGTVALEAQQLVPYDPFARGTSEDTEMYDYYGAAMALRVARQKAVVDTLYQMEKSHIPFPDEPPIIYPDAEVWQLLTARRAERYDLDFDGDGVIDVGLQQPGVFSGDLDVPFVADLQREIIEQLQATLDSKLATVAEVVGPREPIRRAQEDRAKYFDEVVKLTDELHQIASHYRAMKERTATLADELADANEVLQGGLKPEPHLYQAAPAAVEGVVSDVRADGLAEISLGSDDGLVTGQSLEVVRSGDSGGTSPGRVEVKGVKTSPDLAVVEILPKSLRGVIQQGDRVTSSLRQAAAGRMRNRGYVFHDLVGYAPALNTTLAERRLVEMPSGKTLLSQTFAEGSVRWLDHDGELLAERKCRLEPCGAPTLKPDGKELVILPMPLRSREHLRRTLKLEKDTDYEAWGEDGVKVGIVPPVSRDFRETFFGDEAAELWKTFIRQASATLVGEGARPAAIRLARSLHGMDEAALAEEVFSEAMAGVPEQQLWATTLQAVEYLWHAGEHARADAVLEQLLDRERYAHVAALWRLAAVVAERRGMTARSLACQKASRILADLGAAGLAWDYVTTAVAADPETPVAWKDLGDTFRQEGRYGLADRAYARTLLHKLSEGEWDASYCDVQSRARQSLKGP